MIKYFICFQPRSGSTYLCEKLSNTHKGIVNGFELIDNAVAVNSGLTSLTEIDHQGSFSAPLKKEVVNRFIHSNANKLAVGFKFSHYQIADDQTGFIQFLLENGFKGIFLYRRSVFDTAISQMWSLERSRNKKTPMLELNEPDTVESSCFNESLFKYYMIDSMIQKQHVLSMHKLWLPSERALMAYEDLTDPMAEVSLFDLVCKLLEIRVSDLGNSIQQKVGYGSRGGMNAMKDLQKWRNSLGHLEEDAT
jgi:hypothetical protein